MFKSQSLPFTLLFCLLLLVLLQPLAPLSPAPAYAAGERKDPQAAPVIETRKEPCSTDKFNSLRAELDQTRGGWIERLAPQAHEKFNTARKAYMKYATRCAKKLDLDLKDALSGVVGYDAATNSSSTLPNPHTPEAANANGILFDGSPGTAAPPGVLGVYSMTTFPADPRADGTSADSVNSPGGGALEFGSSLDRTFADGTPYTWSHSYTGDVYDTPGTSITLDMPPATRAFYFYAEPYDTETDDITATANDGTSSYAVSTTNPDGAKYFGFYAPLSGPDISSITVSCPGCGLGFAVGEFGIHQSSGADLRLVKYSEPHNVVQAGDIFTYTIFVDNLGPDIASNVIVSDTLLSSGDVSIQSCAFSVSQGGGSITQFTCTTGALVSTQFGTDIGTFSTNLLEPLSPTSQGRLRASFRLVAQIPIDVTNTTRVTSETFDPNMDNNFAEDTLTVLPYTADLRVVKYSEPHNVVQAGELFTYTIFVDNLGPDISNNVVVSDTLLNSTQVSIQSCAFSVSQGEGGITQFTCTTGDVVSTQFGTDIGTFSTDFLEPLSPSSQGRLRASFRLIANGAVDLTNTTRVSSDTFDPNLNNNFAEDTITVTPAVDLTLTKTAPTDAGAGEEISYTLDVFNNGPSIATNVHVLDYLPAQFKLLTLTPTQGSCEAGVEGDPLRPFDCNFGNLEPATGASITVFGQVRSDTLGDTLLFNDAQVTSDEADTDTANNVDTVSTAIVATCGVLPDQPITLSPPNGKNLKKPTVLLDWTDVNCAVNYKVVVRQNTKDKPNFISVKNLPVSQYTTDPLPVDHDYYWRGIACNGGGCKRSDWSMFRVNQ